MSDEEEAAELALEQAQRVIDVQIRTLNEIDTKAIKLLSLNAVLIGAGVSVVSVAVRSSAYPAEALSNWYTVGGGALLLASTITAALAYTASTTKAGPSANDIRRMVSGRYEQSAVTTGLARSYADWVELNYRENVRNTPLLTVSILTLVLSFVSLTVGTAESIAGPVPGWVSSLLLAVAGVLSRSTGVFEQIRRWRLLN